MGALRFMLAMAVVMSHAGTPFGWRWLGMVDGALAVQMFYVISGFYMALILSSTYAAPGAVSAFAKNRILRLYPMLAAMVLVSAVAFGALHWLGYDAAPLAMWLQHGKRLGWDGLLVLGLSNLTIVGQDLACFVAVHPDTGGLYFARSIYTEPLPGWRFLLLPQAWTVGVELMFYAVAPWLLRCRTAVIVVWIALSLALRIALRRGLGLFDDPFTYRLFPTELALFLAGSLAYRAHAWLQARPRLLSSSAQANWPVTLAILSIVAAYAWLFPEGGPNVMGLSPLLALLVAALPFMFAATRSARRDRALGEFSYPVYIAHYSWVFGLDALGQPWLDDHKPPLVIALTLLTAHGLLRWVAAPVERLRDRVRSQESSSRRAELAS